MRKTRLFERGEFSPMDFPIPLLLASLPSRPHSIPLFSTAAAAVSPLFRMKYFMCGGIWRHRSRRGRSRFYINAATRRRCVAPPQNEVERGHILRGKFAPCHRCSFPTAQFHVCCISEYFTVDAFPCAPKIPPPIRCVAYTLRVTT